MEAIEEYGTANETVYFMRAGSTMSPGVTSLFWMGDQMTTLDKYDGLQSALIGLLNGGMSGFGIGHSDIGGYTSLNMMEYYIKYVRDKEIMMRWIEMNAFSDALFRTHPSNNPDLNVQIWDNEEIAGFFGRFAAIFASLGEYRMKLMQETEQTGVPITRSLALEYDDPNLSFDDQFMLGSEIMMAPIFKKGQISRKVYFPNGAWEHFFTGEKILVPGNGIWKEVSTPIGRPAVFKKVAETM